MTAEPDEEPTMVVFRRWPKTQGGDVVALFPLLSEGPGLCACYAHVGQHGQANYTHVMNATRPTNFLASDVQALAEELRSIGYVLQVRQRAPSWRKRRRVAP